jgi:hypothetical protein
MHRNDERSTAGSEAATLIAPRDLARLLKQLVGGVRRGWR